MAFMFRSLDQARRCSDMFYQRFHGFSTIRPATARGVKTSSESHSRSDFRRIMATTLRCSGQHRRGHGSGFDLEHLRNYDRELLLPCFLNSSWDHSLLEPPVFDVVIGRGVNLHKIQSNSF